MNDFNPMNKFTDTFPKDIFESIINRIENLEKKYEENLTVHWSRMDRIENHQLQLGIPKDASEIVKRLTDLEESYQGLFCEISHLQDEMGNLKKQIGDWEEEFYFLKDKLRSRESKPHKCPVCDGSGFGNPEIRTVSHSMTINGVKCVPGDPIYHKAVCNSCEGKGIVWG